jgi:DNA-directed RNA polymerase subunit N (RpoN/RPB10)
MILPIRCFTCNRVLCDGKVFLYEDNTLKEVLKTENEDILINKFRNLLLYFEKYKEELGLDDISNELVFTPSRLNENKKVEYINYIKKEGEEKDQISKSDDFHLLNILSVDKICCRRMFLGYVNMIDKIV